MRPESIDMDAARLETAYNLLEIAVRDGAIPGAALLVGRRGAPIETRCFGRQYLDADDPITPETVFLTASVSKPVTVAAAMLLAQRGLLLLDEAAAAYVPEFGNRGKERVLIRHLMTHTSGLPDMLPENTELRRQHQPLSEFVRRVCALELGFEPGSRIAYQSMGTAIVGEIVQRISGVSLPDFLKSEIFDPLGMEGSSLGTREDIAARIAHVNVGEAMRGADWGWNTPYWHGFGAPWGGMFATTSDLFRLLSEFLRPHVVFSSATTTAMTRDQTAPMPAIPASQKYADRWGLGWKLQPVAGACFGDLVSPGAFGHFGATGTVVWADPVTDLICVLLTTEPLTSSGDLALRCCNIVAASAI